MANVKSVTDCINSLSTSVETPMMEYEAYEHDEEELDKIDHILNAANCLLLRNISNPYSFDLEKSKTLNTSKWYEVLDHNGERVLLVQRMELSKTNNTNFPKPSTKITKFITTTCSGKVILSSCGCTTFSAKKFDIKSCGELIGRLQKTTCSDYKIFDADNEGPVLINVQNWCSKAFHWIKCLFCCPRNSFKIYSYFEDENSKNFIGHIEQKKWKIYGIQNERLFGISFESNATLNVTIVEKLLILGSCYVMLL